MEFDKLCAAINVWFEKAVVLNGGDSGSLAELGQELRIFFSALARQAPKVFDCTHLQDGIGTAMGFSTTSAPSGEGTESAAMDQILECQEQVRVASFLRATTQCAELGLRLCVCRLRGQQDVSEASSLLSLPIDQSTCNSIWNIMGVMEPRLFLDLRPFWAGTGDPSVAQPMWQLYVRLFLLTGFGVQHRLRKQRREELCRKRAQRLAPVYPSGEAETDDGADAESSEQNPVAATAASAFDPERDRRAFRHPSDVGLGAGPDDEYDPSDAESWTMSMLFGCLDVMADEWTDALYTTSNISLVSRCLLRYAMIGYTRTSPEMRKVARKYGTSPVHDMLEYTARGTHRAEGWIGVNVESYYGQGGAILRDMLGDLYRVVAADAWLSFLCCSGPYTQDRFYSATTWAARCLAQRLYQVLAREGGGGGGQSFDDDDEHLLVMHCFGAGLFGIVGESSCSDGLASLPRIETTECAQEVARRCFDAMAEFLAGGSGAEAEKAVGQSGVVHILQPGEIWRFIHRWPDRGVTPVNIVNGLRSRDMTLYQDHVLSQPLSALMRSRGRKLPACLAPLTDHLVLETFRHMLRLVTLREGTEAFPFFLMEPHQWRSVLLEFSSFETSTSHAHWARFYRWTRVVQFVQQRHHRHGHGPSHDRSFLWDAVMRTVAKILGDQGPQGLRGGAAEYPPFPQILMFGGRVFLWNPLAKPLPDDYWDIAYTDDDDDDDDEERVLQAWIPLLSEVRPWLAEPLVEVSTNAMPITVILWLCGRMMLVLCILRRLEPNQQVHSTVFTMGITKRDMYLQLLERLLHDPAEEEQEKAEAGADDGDDMDAFVAGWEPMETDSTAADETQE